MAIQYWNDLEVIVNLQNATPKFKNRVERVISRQPFSSGVRFQVNVIDVAEGVDGRSRMLNHGIRTGTGRYLAFLDDDDVVYHHGYSTLIDQLKRSQAAVAVGGCRVANLSKEHGNWYFQTKSTPFVWGRNRLDLFRDNFIPIHSFVIDRSRVNEEDLYFDENLSLLEDYDFLLRLSAKNEFEFSKIDTFVCEYRMHGENSLPRDTQIQAEVAALHLNALEVINERKKKSYLYNISVADLVDLVSAKSSLMQQANEARAALEAREAQAAREAQEALETQAAMEAQLAREALTPILHSSNPIEQNNPQIVKKILDSAANSIYAFFARHPAIEKRLSKSMHYLWRGLKRT